MVFLCISIHSASPVWVYSGWPEWPGGGHFLWISYVFAYILLSSVRLQWVAGVTRWRSFPMDFLWISTHSASPVWVCSGWPEWPCGGHFLWISYVFPYILPLQCGSAVGGRNDPAAVISYEFPDKQTKPAKPVFLFIFVFLANIFCLRISGSRCLLESELENSWKIGDAQKIRIPGQRGGAKIASLKFLKHRRANNWVFQNFSRAKNLKWWILIMKIDRSLVALA